VDVVDFRYQAQVDLLLCVLPHVFQEEEFALKGGTAINLFHRALPRLSVDIDLTYLRLDPRETALQTIEENLENLAERLKRFVPRVKRVVKRQPSGKTVGLIVEGVDSLVKIEPNRVIRGTVFPCEVKELHPGGVRFLGDDVYVKVKSLAYADLFGGKICAALDRQHPRDLYDVCLLLREEGFTRDVRKAFIVYLISHDRPLHELLDPRAKDIREIYERELVGMVRESVPLDDLKKTLSRLVQIIHRDLTSDERIFLISFKEGQPRWDLLGISGVDKLPAPAWKLENIKKMNTQKHKDAVRNLKNLLEK